MRSRRVDRDTLRITTQYRERSGMVYELEERGARLSLHISPQGEDDEIPSWSVKAQTGRDDDAVTIARSGPTRAAALREVGNAWTANGANLGAPGFDWTAVETALMAVRAL